jgi:uncharacterized membrane protein YoaK (UPF0700 family)
MLARSSPLNRTTASPAAVKAWRVWLALLTAFAFVLLVTTATQHHHASSAEDLDCSICSVVMHKLADAPLMHLQKLLIVFIAFAFFQASASCILHTSPLWLPPSCGPPQN